MIRSILVHCGQHSAGDGTALEVDG